MSAQIFVPASMTDCIISALICSPSRGAAAASSVSLWLFSWPSPSTIWNSSSIPIVSRGTLACLMGHSPSLLLGVLDDPVHPTRIGNRAKRRQGGRSHPWRPACLHHPTDGRRAEVDRADAVARASHVDRRDAPEIELRQTAPKETGHDQDPPVGDGVPRRDSLPIRHQEAPEDEIEPDEHEWDPPNQEEERCTAGDPSGFPEDGESSPQDRERYKEDVGRAQHEAPRDRLPLPEHSLTWPQQRSERALIGDHADPAITYVGTTLPAPAVTLSSALEDTRARQPETAPQKRYGLWSIERSRKCMRPSTTGNGYRGTGTRSCTTYELASAARKDCS